MYGGEVGGGVEVVVVGFLYDYWEWIVFGVFEFFEEDV